MSTGSHIFPGVAGADGRGISTGGRYCRLTRRGSSIDIQEVMDMSLTGDICLAQFIDDRKVSHLDRNGDITSLDTT